MNITSEDQIIDYDSIELGANGLLTIAESFEECSKKLNEAANVCDATALSVDGVSYQDKIYTLAEQMNSIALEIATYVSDLIEKANNKHNEQIAEYNSYLASLNVQNEGDGA